MTEEQRALLLKSLKEVHDRVHTLYPRGEEAIEEAGRALRNRLLAVDLVVHLAEELIRTDTPDERQVAERTANLLYALKLVAPQHRLGHAAEILVRATQSEAGQS